MRTTFLFDLDGTLVPLDQDEFIRGYFRLLVPELAPYLAPEQIPDAIMKATYYMINDLSTTRTNREAFVHDFSKRVSGDVEELMELFERFYRGKFAQLKSLVTPVDEITAIVRTLQEKGYDLVCATNAIFPLSAIETRLSWVGLTASDFIFITSFENMHFCKPHIEYYYETLEKINRNPQECFMVGNDVEEDMIAGQLGIETFLVTNYLIDRGSGIKPDHKGTYADLLEFVRGLPDVSLDETGSAAV